MRFPAVWRSKTMKGRVIRIYGVVQGVGFRPFVARTATALDLTGSVANKGSYVEVLLSGSEEALASFRRKLETDPPVRSAILRIDEQDGEVPETTEFRIVESEKDPGNVFVSPDIATCDQCRKELFDPADRRYLHPFINCTSCGPRLTILDHMPYDRIRTAMKDFPMCDACHYEYTHAETRRYDAQPVCCNECGPRLFMLSGEEKDAQAITRARSILVSGGILAVKGIGGFHLCCDARNPEAVHLLRSRKRRKAKPFAIMMKDMETVRKECIVPPEMEKIMTSFQKPILLLEKRPDCTLCEDLAPGNPTLGVMLPYAPVQMLLFDYPDGITMTDTLVMTSGNVSGVPICRSDAEACSMIGAFCDGILSHDRPIYLRADDSVMDHLEGKPYMIRRSRGYAPLPFIQSMPYKGHVLGVGGELKNSFCLAQNELFYLSAYIGDMEDIRTVEALKESIERMKDLLEIRPQLAVCDLHPKYNTTRVAEDLAIPIQKIQHHYAHILACMAENDCAAETVLGISFDGTGYGSDGSIWGGEYLLCNAKGFERMGHIAPFMQVGGDASSREGWRIAASMIHSLEGGQALSRIRELDLCTEQEGKVVGMMARKQLNSILSSSSGRLFDAASAILGIKKCSSFEGESAMALEFAAREYAKKSTSYPEMDRKTLLAIREDGSFTANTDRLIHTLMKRHLAGEDPTENAYMFHAILADMIAEGCMLLREKTSCNICALSGGVFQNKLLMTLCLERLRSASFRILTHSLVPPNDGCIALGQALWGMHFLNQNIHI